MEIAAAIPDPVPVTISAQAQKPLIHIFVRHGKHCPYKGDEGWKRCTCLKWVRWGEGGKLHREPPSPGRGQVRNGSRTKWKAHSTPQANPRRARQPLSSTRLKCSWPKNLAWPKQPG